MSAAHKSENPAATGFNATNQSTDSADFNADRYATLVIAKLEQAGHHVSRLENNGFLASRWNMTLHCPTLENLAQFAKSVGAMQ